LPSPPSARQAGRTPAADALFADDVVARNALRLRLERGWSQTDLGLRMQNLGHATWTQAIVSRTERLLRPIGLSELLGLALVLEVTPPELLDPTQLDGVEALDLDGPGEIAADLASAWIAGRVRAHLQWDGAVPRAGALTFADAPGGVEGEAVALVLGRGRRARQKNRQERQTEDDR